MSPLIHRSLTWTIVATVVSMSAWLAGNVQQAHERQGLRQGLKMGAMSAPHASLSPALPAPVATHASTLVQTPAHTSVVTPDTQPAVQVASSR